MYIVYDRIFYLLDQINVVRTGMKIEKQNSLSNLSSPCLRHLKASNFTSGWLQYHARLETGDSGAVASIQEFLVALFLCSLVVSF